MSDLIERSAVLDLMRTNWAANEGDTAMQLSIDDVRNMPAPTECEDAISREAMLDGLTSIAKAKAKSDAQKALMGRVMFFTEKLPRVTPKQRWIPVSEGLPKSNGVYNVTRLIDEAYITDSCFYDGQGTWYDDTRINHDRKHLDDVIAWIPLPERYKEGESE